MIELLTDSGDYDILAKGVELSKNTEGMTCEIGLRRGGGTKVIMDELKRTGQNKLHIAIDPFGHIEYEHKENDFVRLDYTNDMRDECLTNLYAYARQIGINFNFFNMEDTEFFKRFADGVPIYDVEKRIEKKYSFVHFDGPHAIQPLIGEINFFKERISEGACWVFDDVIGYYDHDSLEKEILLPEFKLIKKGKHKALYQYEG